MTQKQVALNIDSLNETVDNNHSVVIQTMRSSNENFDDKINTLSQHVAIVASMKSEIASMKSDISAMKSCQQDERRDKRLERAMTLTHLNSFKYYDGNYDGNSSKSSKDLAKKVLELFLLGHGVTLPADATLEESFFCKDLEASKKAFREKFTKQIKALIIREPRLVEYSDGSFAIFYS